MLLMLAGAIPFFLDDPVLCFVAWAWQKCPIWSDTMEVRSPMLFVSLTPISGKEILYIICLCVINK